MPHLLELPDEILSHIIAACAHERDFRHRLSSDSPGRQTILNFAKSCHRAFSLAEPWLYNTLTLRKGLSKSEFFRNFKQRLLDKPRRETYVRDVALVPSSGDVDPDLLSWASFVAVLPQVEHLHIEVPFAQSDATDDEETGDYVSPFWSNFRKTFTSCIPGTSIPNWASSLRTCHLNFHAPNGYSSTLGDIVNVIAAPQIREVSLIAANLSNFELDRKRIRPRTSPLQHLCLENCTISGSALRHILSIPKGLVSLTEFGGITPNESTTHHDRLYNLIQALIQHKATLRVLNVNPRDLRTLTDFESSTSKTISFVPLTHLSYLTIDFRDWRFEPGPTTFLEKLPLRLKHLHVKVEPSQYASHSPRNFEYWANYFAYWANRIRRRTNRYRPLGSTFPRLKRFTGEMMHITPEVIDAPHRDVLETAAWRLKRESKVRMVLYRRSKQRNAIPPYLWDEYQPELVTMLDSDLMETQSLWLDETTSEIEEAKRVEQQFEMDRMIELDQLRLDMKRQRIIKQIEKWEQEEMPVQEDLDAAMAAWKKEKERQEREALDVPSGLPLIPPETACGWDWDTIPSSSTAEPLTGENPVIMTASELVHLQQEGGALEDLPTEPGPQIHPEASAVEGATCDEHSSEAVDNKAHIEHLEEADPSPTTLPPAQANPNSNLEIPATTIVPTGEPSEPTSPVLPINKDPAPTPAQAGSEIEAEQKQREGKDKEKAAAKAGKTAEDMAEDAEGDGDAASIDADGDAGRAEPGPSQDTATVGVDGQGAKTAAAAAAATASGINGAVQTVAVG